MKIVSKRHPQAELELLSFRISNAIEKSMVTITSAQKANWISGEFIAVPAHEMKIKVNK